jgi:hypothetical protein
MISPEDMMGFDYYSTLDGKLTLDQYQNKASATAIYPSTAAILYPALARDLNISLSDIAKENLDKLDKRKKDGKIAGNGDYR